MTKPVKVTVGSTTLWIQPHKTNGWRVHWYDQTGKRQQKSCKDLETLRKFARDKARTIEQSRSRIVLSDEEAAEFRKWQASRQKSRPVGEIVSELLKAKEASQGASSRNVSSLRYNLKPFAERFPVPIIDIEVRQIEKWLFEENTSWSPRTRNNQRASLVTLFRWARDREYLPDKKTEAEKVTRERTRSQKEILTPTQMRTILKNVRPTYLPYVVIAGFLGLRSDELQTRSRETGKRFLEWRDFDWEEGVLVIEEEIVSKSRRRLVTINETAMAWLWPYQNHQGPVVSGKLFNTTESKRLAELMKLEKWPHNCLRHSFGSYLMAKERNVHMVAEEMGNGANDIRNHYDRVVKPSQAEAWWDLTPDRLKIENWWKEAA